LSGTPFHTPLCELLGMPHPIVQPAMGWVATPQLAIAVAEAGAFPFLAAATLSPGQLERAIAETREGTSAPFGVGFVMEQPEVERIVEVIVASGARAAGYNRSPDARLIARLKEGGVACVPTVGRLRHAERAVQLGADALLVQGSEGGGHTGTRGTLSLVGEIVDAVEVPVGASGGFMDGRGLAAALALGASGIAMGTRFLLTAESPVPDDTKRRYLRAASEDAVVCTQVDGLPQRVLRNELVEGLEDGAQPLDEPPVLVRRALVEGDPAGGVLPAGQVVGRIRSLPSCGALVQDVVDEAANVLARLAS
jgi:NAD(P)H-dependent flavin oxidoreductase YrpB (nitropropane dioxygenase family)